MLLAAIIQGSRFQPDIESLLPHAHTLTHGSEWHEDSAEQGAIDAQFLTTGNNVRSR